MRRRLEHAAVLARIVELAEAPREGALVVVGDPGSGRSQLLAEAERSLAGSAVLIRSNPAERAFPLSGLSAVAAAVGDRRAIELGGRFSLRSGDGRVFAAAHDVLALLRGLRLPPTVLLVDDADVLDEESRQLLGLMAERLAGTGLRLVLAVEEVAPRSSFGGTETVELAPLEIPAALALGHATATVEEGTLRLLVQQSAGNPTELREQLLELDPEVLAGRTGVQLPLQPRTGLPAALRRSLGRLRADERRLLEDIALAPRMHLGAVGAGPAPGERGDGTAVLDDLLSDGLLLVRGGCVRIRDPRLRAHVHWSMSGRDRRQRHHALAALHEGLDDRLRVWHGSQEDSGAGTDEALLRAARGFAAEGDVDAASELAERALRLTEPHGRAEPMLVDLAERLLLHGALDAANRYLGFARPHDAGPREAIRAAAIRVAAGALSGAPLADAEVVATAMVHGGAAPDGAVSLLAVAAALRAERWELEASRTLLARADELAVGVGEPAQRLLRAVERTVDAHDGRVDGRTTALDRDLLQHPPLALLRARSAVWSEDHAGARLVLASLMAFPRTSEPLWGECARLVAIENEIASGDHRAARQLIDAPLAVHGTANGALQTLLAAWYRVSLDEEEAAAALLEEAADRALQEADPSLQARTAAVRGAYALLHEDPEETLRQGLVLARLRRGGAPEHQLRHVGDVVDAALRLGLAARADEEIAVFRQRHAQRPTRWGRQVLLRMRAQRSAGAEAVPLFRSAVDAFRPGDSPYELGRTQLVYAERLAELGLQEEALTMRTAAVAAFDAAGSVGWAARAAGTASEPASSVAAAPLTDEERAIVRLVRGGARNREIAEALHLSVRTVEQRLTRIYRTLGIVSRSQLGDALAGTVAGRGVA